MHMCTLKKLRIACDNQAVLHSVVTKFLTWVTETKFCLEGNQNSQLPFIWKPKFFPAHSENDLLVSTAIWAMEYMLPIEKLSFIANLMLT